MQLCQPCTALQPHTEHKPRYTERKQGEEFRGTISMRGVTLVQPTVAMKSDKEIRGAKRR